MFARSWTDMVCLSRWSGGAFPTGVIQPRSAACPRPHHPGVVTRVGIAVVFH